MMLDLASQLRRLALDVLAKLAFAPALLARVVIGVVFVGSGFGKLQHLEQVIQFFTELGIPAPHLQAPFVAGTELVCGALVLVGLGARIFAVPLVATMVVALATAVEFEGLSGLFGTIEFLYVALLFQIAVYGPGALSLDALLARAIARREAPLHAHDRGHAHGAVRA
jgi:putative oxidoreductase